MMADASIFGGPMSECNRKQLLATNKREWSQTIPDVKCAVIVPGKRVRKTEWSFLRFVAEREDGSLIGSSGCFETIRLYGDKFSIDCYSASGCIRVWNDENGFKITEESSTVDFIQNTPSESRLLKIMQG